MNLQRLQRLLKFNKKYNSRIFWTGFLFIGVLSFCYSQIPDSTFLDKLEALGTTESEKREAKYYSALRSLQLEYKSHLDTNCNDKAALYRNLGMHFYDSRDRETALYYFQDTALQIAINCQNVEDQLITQIYLNLLNCKIVLDQKQYIPPIIDRLKWYLSENKAGPLAHKANIQSDISRYYNDIGDYDQSMIWIKNSIANHNKLPLSERKLRAYLEWGYILFSLEDYRNAIAVFDSTRLLAKNLNLLDEPIYNEYIIYNKAACYEPLGQYNEAIHFIELYASMTDPKDLIVQSDIANLKAYKSDRNGNYQSAILQMQKSIQLSIESNDDYQLAGLAKDYLFKSKVYLKQENYSKAAAASISALEKAIVPKPNWQDNIFNFSNLFVKNPNGFNESALAFFKAITHYEPEEKVLSFANQLDSTFFSLQTYYSGDESKSEITTRHHEFCEELLNYIFEHQLENKYQDLTAYYISTSKSLALFEKLSVKKGIPEELQNEFNAINTQWNEIYSALEVQESIGNRAIVDSLAQINFQLNLRKDKLDKKLATLNLVPNFRNLNNSLSTKAKANLKKGEALTDFFYGNNHIYSWYLDATGIHFTSETIHPILSQDFIPMFSSTEMSYLQDYDQRIDSLSNYFAPFFQHLDSDISKLTLIPDGKLLYFPFEVLQVNNKPLIEQASIQYLFSYSINEIQDKNKQRKVKPYIGFAMEYEEGILQDIRESKDIQKMYQDNFMLSKLPYAVEEVKMGEALFAGQSYLDKACTRANFFEVAENFQLLHIANHALLNEQNSYLSSIVFNQDGKADMINVLDIKKLNLNADLAILSSCNSGRGENIKGSGLRSLGLSFAEAGCPAVVVNLWEASDKSTKQIIESFSRHLKKGLTKSLALQKAKLEYIKSVPRELQHPKYWANIVLIGEDAPIVFGQAWYNNWIFYLVLGLLLLIGGGLLARKWF